MSRCECCSADLAKNGFASPPASPPKNRCAKLAPPPPPPPPPANFEPQRQPIARKQTRQLETAPLGTRPPPPAGLEAEIWQYVSDRPAPVEWQPGCVIPSFASLSDKRELTPRKSPQQLLRPRIRLPLLPRPVRHPLRARLHTRRGRAAFVGAYSGRTAGLARQEDARVDEREV